MFQMLQYLVFPPFLQPEMLVTLHLQLSSQRLYGQAGDKNFIQQSNTKDENTAMIVRDEPQSVAISIRRLDHLNEAGCFCSGLGAASRHTQNHTFLLTMSRHSHSSPSKAELT